eukprot:1169011-Pyramimonas_sp.AAC.1
MLPRVVLPTLAAPPTVTEHAPGAHQPFVHHALGRPNASAASLACVVAGQEERETELLFCLDR